jgi:hypothetical protein
MTWMKRFAGWQKESNNIEWKFYTDLIERVCENPQARKYIDNAHTKRNYDKFKPILERLLNHTHVKQTNCNPLTLAWIPNSAIAPIERNDFGMQNGRVEADGNSIGKKEVEDKSKSISTFRHFDISTSRSALNYFYGNNFDNDQNAVSKYATDLP